MKRNWLPILLGIIITWVIVAEVIDSSRKQKEEDKRFAEYLATEEHDSAWLAPVGIQITKPAVKKERW